VPSTYRALGIAVGYPGVRADLTLDLAEAAERAGFGIVTCGDSIVETFSTLGAVAARTSRVELVSAIATWTRTPVTAALAATTLADIAKGRYSMGLGTMPKDWSEGWHDISYAKPVERMRDYVAAIRAAMVAAPGAPITHDGPYYSIPSYARIAPPPPYRIPIYLSPTRVGMAELTGEIADGAILNATHSVGYLEDVQLPAIARGLARSGRTRADVDLGQMVFTSISDNEQEALDWARPSLAFYFPVPYWQDILRHGGWHDELEAGLAASARGDFPGMLAATTDEIVRACTLSGTPDQVRAAAARYEGLIDWPLFSAPLGLPPEISQGIADRIVQTFATGSSA
jgi:alkanesulfonate monooxygenase SsuD/methylene tetrahydromethanopterin reductase-like flavin-dependent oxidoreductase (luciferase family)